MAFVILKPDHMATWKGKHDQFEAELKKHARGRLPGFACPEWVQVVSDLPVHTPLRLLEAFRS
jgi:acyl-coenzyme A synthetase/AMP-(fatty) acid ligase